MRRTLAVVLVLLAPAPALAADPTGLWWAEGGAAQVAIERCGDALCGRLVSLRSPFDAWGCAARDAENPDPALRDRPLVGIELLRDLRSAGEGEDVWEGGRVYDPTSGMTFDAELRMAGPDRLHLRGYLGLRLLGRTTTWTRVGSERQCRDGS